MSTTETKWRNCKKKTNNIIDNNTNNTNTNNTNTNNTNTNNTNNNSNKSSNISFENPFSQSEDSFKKMFQNIYSTADSNYLSVSGSVGGSESESGSTSELKEGFDIFGEDFDIHKKPASLIKMEFANEFGNIIAEIRDYILCPIYNSDVLIEYGIQRLLSIFLAVSCQDLNTDLIDAKDLIGKKEESQVIDMTDLIDPNLLYSDGFTNMKEGFDLKKKIRTDCGLQKEKAAEDIKKYSGKIKHEIYKLLFLPLVIHIFYNIYYMFFFTDVAGNKPEFINVEKDFYDPYLKPYLDYFFSIAIKPVYIFYLILTWISNIDILRRFNKDYPYAVYLILFGIIYSIVESYNKNIISVIGDMLLTKSNPFLIFSLIIMFIYFPLEMLEKIPTEWYPTLEAHPISGAIKCIIYWVIKLVINLFIYPLGSYLCVLYFIVYTFFGIFMNQTQDVFEVYSDIDEMVYNKIYEREKSCVDDGWISFLNKLKKTIPKYLFIYLIEIVIISILSNGFNTYIKHINNVNVQSFLFIMNFTGIFITGVWMFIKYMTTIKDLDVKYGVLNYVKKSKEDEVKKARLVELQKKRDMQDGIGSSKSGEKNKVSPVVARGASAQEPVVQELLGGAEVPAVSGGEVPAVSEGEVPEVSEAEVPAVSEGEVPAVSEAEVPVVSEAEVPVVSEAEVPAVSEAEVPVVSEAEVPAVPGAVPSALPSAVPGAVGVKSIFAKAKEAYTKFDNAALKVMRVMVHPELLYNGKL